MKPKVFQYIVLSLLLFFCTSACNDSDARENSNQPLPSTPEEAGRRGWSFYAGDYL